MSRILRPHPARPWLLRCLRPRRAVGGAVLVSLLFFGLAGCAANGGQNPASPAGTGTPAVEDTTLTVFAAASLGDSFEEIADRFEAQHPGVDVQSNFAGSSTLVEQLAAGAPADVFASADEPNMERAVANGDMATGAAGPVDFATNVLTLVTPPDNPANVTSLQDAAAEGVSLVVCAPQVPCGNASQQVAEDAGVQLNPVSEESSVTNVLGKVVSGEADAGLVYVTDARGAGDEVNQVELPNAEAAVNTYPIGVTAATDQPDLAQEFVDFVVGPPGREVLAEAGFGAP